MYKKDYSNIIPKLLELGANINKMNKGGYTPAHYLVTNSDIDMLKIFMNHNLDISLVSPKLGNVNFLQYVFREGRNPEMIKYMIDLNISLDIDINLVTPCEQLIYLNSHLNKKQKQQLVLLYLTNLLKKAVVIDNYMQEIKNDSAKSQ
jgi:ankyrin repeat protein